MASVILPLQGKVALVTGATGGIGTAVCQRLAAQGAQLVLQYRSKERDAETLVNTLPQPQKKAGEQSRHTCFQADLSDAQQVKDLVDFAAHRRNDPSLDILVNTAGIAHTSHSPMTVSYTEWQQSWQETLAVNLIGAANLSYCAASYMASTASSSSVSQNGGGRIVHISSRGAFRGEPQYPAYGASKAGLNALSQSLAIALAPQGIGVYAVAPGFVETSMAEPFLDTPEKRQALEAQSPLNRIATPHDVAYWVEVLVKPEATFATGAIIDVNGASYLRT